MVVVSDLNKSFSGSMDFKCRKKGTDRPICITLFNLLVIVASYLFGQTQIPTLASFRSFSKLPLTFNWSFFWTTFRMAIYNLNIAVARQKKNRTAELKCSGLGASSAVSSVVIVEGALEKDVLGNDRGI